MTTSEPFVLCVCGGRDYVPTAYDFAFLDFLHGVRPVTLLVHGAASGADTALGQAWAQQRLVEQKAFPADWATHGRAAGPIRNAEMAAVAHAVVAAPGGRGTANMIRHARRGHLPVHRLPGDWSVLR